MLSKYRRLAAGMILAGMIGSASGRGALGAEGLAQTVGAWIVACHQTEAGGRECEVRNDEGGKPALEQEALLSLTLHDGRNDAEGLARIADLDLPPRLEVEIAFGEETISVDGVGRRRRLAARFALPVQELANLATADAIEVRFTDKGGQQHVVSFAPAGLEEALTIAREHLSP